MRIFVWLFRAFVFFALFAFSLNNQQAASVNWFFGYAWNAPMVFIVLSAFAAGTAFGVIAMAPNWWRQRRSKLAEPGDTGASLAVPGASAATRNTPPDVPARLVDGV